MRFNHLQPPFDDPVIRQAIVGAATHSDYMTGMVGTDAALWRDKVGYFCPGTPLANDAGIGALTRPRDLSAVRRMLESAGYAGEKVVVQTPTDIAAAHALAEITADLFRKLGMNVEAPAMDWATLVQRRVKTGTVAGGGWSVFHTSWSGADTIDPAGHVSLRGNGKAAAPGWPDSPDIETLCDAWFAARDLKTQRDLAIQLQQQAFQNVSYIPLGQYFQPTPNRSDLTGILQGSPLFWNIKRG
jgi:peptide/nickel transport system substrate-binding protein